MEATILGRTTGLRDSKSPALAVLIERAAWTRFLAEVSR
ncbi:DUF397 domain-containing protein [Embleya sp. NBC_00896]